MKILVPMKRVTDPDNANKVEISSDGKGRRSYPELLRGRC